MTRLQTYSQLVRLPNLPSALADICLGAFAAHSVRPDEPFRWFAFLQLLAASACLYCGGMVWNDYFDVEQDKRERPDRPIPSGRVSRAEAGWLGILLLAAGLLFALFASLAIGSLLPLDLAGLLVLAILDYDAWLKRTVLGPVGMGACRFLNVLLAVSICGSLLWPRGMHLAFVVGLYIVGVTWFARTEARQSNQWTLVGALAVMLFALILAIPLGAYREAGTSSIVFPYLLVAVGFGVGLPAAQAVRSPTPELVQGAVKRGVDGAGGP